MIRPKLLVATRATLVALGLAVLLALVACGGTEETTASAAQQDTGVTEELSETEPAQTLEEETIQGAATTIVLVASEWRFDPTTITFRAGEPVTLVLQNDGKILHNVELHGLDVFLEAEPGERVQATFTPNQSGTFSLACILPGHKELGMEGVISVH